MASRYEWVTLLVGVMTSLIHPNHGAYHSGGDKTFCEALQYCTDRGQTLPYLSNLTALQEYMKKDKHSVAWMLDDDEDSIEDAMDHCDRILHSPESCPGLVALPVSVGELRHPIAQCLYSKAEVAVCEPPSSANSFRLADGSRGNFCDAVDKCKANGLDIVSSSDSETVRGVLNDLKTKSVWSLSADAAKNWKSFCKSSQPRQCPGSIILRQPSSYVKHSLIGCSTAVTFPVICHLPEASTTRTNMPSLPPKTSTPKGNTAGKEDDSHREGEEESNGGGQLSVIIGVVVGIVVALVLVIVITVLLVRNKRRTGHSKAHITHATNLTYSVEGHDIISGIMDHDYADITDVTDPPSARSKQPLPSEPPPVGTEPGYSQVTDKVGDKGEYLGTYEDIDDLREDLNEDKPNSHRKAENTYSVIPGEQGSQYIPFPDDVSPSQGVPRVLDNPYDLEVANRPDVPPETPAPPGPIGAAQDDDVYPDEVTLVENTVYG